MISRPLSYSLTVHLFLLALLVYALSHESKKESRTSLKLQMISISSTSVTPPKRINPQPKTLPQSTIMPKPTPIIPKLPTPVTKTPLMPVTVPKPPAMVNAVSTPQHQIVPPVITTIPAPVEIAKAVHTLSVAPSVPSVTIEKEFLDAHLGEIRALLIQNMRYPRNAQRLKMQGEVRIGFRLKSDGSVENIEVIQSSGFEILDEDAKTLIKNTAPQFPKPSKSITLNVPLAYILR